MGRTDKVIAKILRGEDVQFDALVGLALSLGFTERRSSGSHVILSHPKLRRPLCIQRAPGTKKAKTVCVVEVAEALKKIGVIDE